VRVVPRFERPDRAGGSDGDLVARDERAHERVTVAVADLGVGQQRGQHVDRRVAGGEPMPLVEFEDGARRAVAERRQRRDRLAAVGAEHRRPAGDAVGPAPRERDDRVVGRPRDDCAERVGDCESRPVADPVGNRFRLKLRGERRQIAFGLRRHRRPTGRCAHGAVRQSETATRRRPSGCTTLSR